MLRVETVFPYVVMYHEEKYFKKDKGYKPAKFCKNLEYSKKEKIYIIVRAIEWKLYSKKFNFYVKLNVLIKNSFSCQKPDTTLYIDHDGLFNLYSEYGTKYDSLFNWIDFLDIDFTAPLL